MLSVPSTVPIFLCTQPTDMRKGFDAKESYPLESAVVLAKFQELYDIEDRAKALSPEGRLDLRQTAATPVWADLETWLDSEAAVRASSIFATSGSPPCCGRSAPEAQATRRCCSPSASKLW